MNSFVHFRVTGQEESTIPLIIGFQVLGEIIKKFVRLLRGAHAFPVGRVGDDESRGRARRQNGECIACAQA